MTSAPNRSGPDDRARVGEDRAHEALHAAPDPGHRDRELALGGLDPARQWPLREPVASGVRSYRAQPWNAPVSSSTARRRTSWAPRRPSRPGASSPLRSTRSIAPSIRAQIHGVASFCGFQGPLRSLRRLHFPSVVRTPPRTSDREPIRESYFREGRGQR